MNGKKYKWINDDIKIDFPINNIVLNNAIADAEKFDSEGDCQYFGMASSIDVLCKMMVANGHMTEKQWDIIVSRYPED